VVVRGVRSIAQLRFSVAGDDRSVAGVIIFEGRGTLGNVSDRRRIDFGVEPYEPAVCVVSRRSRRSQDRNTAANCIHAKRFDSRLGRLGVVFCAAGHREGRSCENEEDCFFHCH